MPRAGVSRKTVRLNPELYIHYRSQSEDLVRSVANFCEVVYLGIKEGHRLEKLLPLAFRVTPEARLVFDFDPRSPVESFKLSASLAYRSDRVTQVNLSEGRPITWSPKLTREQQVHCLAAGASGRYSRRELAAYLPDALREPAERLLRDGVFVEESVSPRECELYDQPGIYRLQHAALLFRSQRAGVLVDPHLCSGFGADSAKHTVLPAELQGKVDAILVSHFHRDHFDLPSLLMFPRDIPIVFPKPQRGTFLNWDLERCLREQGFRNLIEADWWSAPLWIDDIEIQALPFYGEQATRYEHPVHPGVWNDGNTYLIGLNGIKAWFLIDAGQDIRGSTEEVAHELRRREGPIDVVLSNLRYFSAGHWRYINAGMNWLTLSGDQLERYTTFIEHVLTVGSEGCAEICRVVGAKTFLPYAHWWHDVGRSLAAPEGRDLRVLRENLRKIGATTQVEAWPIGGRFGQGGIA